MATILIAYDLNRPAQNYAGLIEKIKSYGAWWHHLDSTWLVKTSKSPVEIRDDLARTIDQNDELLVIDVTGDARAWRGFDAGGSKWLHETF